MSQAIWTIREVMKTSKDYLTQKGISNSRLDVELLLSHALAVERIKLYTDFDRPLTVDERSAFKNLLYRRANHEPVAHILGEAGFMGHIFKVTKDTLIPRPDTEILVELALGYLPEGRPLSVLDIGTGTGCVGISLLKARQSVEVESWDICEKSLQVARFNAERMNVDSRYTLRIASALDESSYKNRFDLIVSNPPYIAPNEKDEMDREVLKYEPHAALFGGSDGLIFYQCIARYCRSILSSSGRLVLEIGWKQAEHVKRILSDNDYTDIEIHKDLNDRSRVITGIYKL